METTVEKFNPFEKVDGKYIHGEFYYVTRKGTAHIDFPANSSTEYTDCGNCYKTLEEAEAVAKKVRKCFNA